MKRIFVILFTLCALLGTTVALTGCDDIKKKIQGKEKSHDDDDDDDDDKDSSKSKRKKNKDADGRDNVRDIDVSESDAKKYNESTIQKLAVRDVTAYDVHKPSQGNYYLPTYMIDGDPATAWSIDMDHYPYEMEMLDGAIFYFDRPVRIAYAVVTNGYGKSAERFHQNSRLRNLVMYNVDDPQNRNTFNPSTALFSGSLEDHMAPQRIEFNRNSAANHNINAVGMRIPYPLQGGVICGDKWNDLCVSEVEFWGWYE